MHSDRDRRCHCGSGRKFKNCCGRSGTGKPGKPPPAAAGINLPNGATVSVETAIQSAVQLHQSGKLKQALAIYDRILQAVPGHGDALHLKGLIAHQTGNHRAAAELIEKAIAAHPGTALYHNNLAKVLLALHRHREAASACGNALALQPDLPEALYLMGNALLAQEQADAAAPFIERLLETAPDFFNAYTILVEIRCRQGRAEEALAVCRQALERYPDNPPLICATGIALVKLGRTGELIAHYEHALTRNPGFAQAENNLANAFATLGRAEEAIAHYQKALALAPDYADTNSSMLMAFNYLTHQDAQATYLEHLKYAQRFEAPVRASIQPHRNDRTAGRRLRIGYVSSDFRQHAVAHFIEPVLRHHDRARFEITCYSNSLTEDRLTRRLRDHAARWRNITRLSDSEAARLIRDDGIDILVDLNGHTSGNRLPVFARKPAPIQMTWIGYPNTTGLSAMDYRITDAYADPAGLTERYHSEQLIRLPQTFSCYQPPDDCPETAPLPARRSGHITFGSFNNLTKITPEVIALWSRILLANPGAHLTVKTGALDDAARRQALLDAFLAHAPLADRLHLLGHSASTAEHFSCYNDIDIGLDPFPYNGTTTTCDALWMGVPVIVLEGNTHVARVGISQLSNLGMPELIARNPDDYLAIATRLAADPDQLENIRQTLRARMRASPLMDAAALTRNLETTYATKWQVWCAGTT